jgi:hypothetical protein
MNPISKKTSLIILGVTSLVGSRVFFSLINDPEGPNLLVIVVMAAIIYFVSIAAYLYPSSHTGFKKLFLAILTQVAVVAIFHFFLG